ncbi:linker for activation of T-cells family member 2 isoform X2 [Choloepus didactylus]|uniref:linker for activation of T-cells family member 2 isoform X2 n=1 Tax=Choloepus didactylus TaxID=27675 RepID=UPI00189DE19C|nr:linker for activation of T-cells family member 2 isoform X2 [Choloepus didactylus]
MIQWLTGSRPPCCPPVSVAWVSARAGVGSGWGGRSEEPPMLRKEPDADMSLETELLWMGASLLLLLGAAAGLCVRCSRPGAKRSEKIYEQRSPQDNSQSFAVARTYSLVRQVCPRPLAEPASDASYTRKDKLLQFSPSLEDSAAPRYQNFSKGSRCRSDAAYIDPIAVDIPHWRRFQKEDEDDTNSYENVLICKPSHLEPSDEESEDYQNSASIQQWRESRRAVELVQREAPQSPVGGLDEDGGEPDYVNGSLAGALGEA